MLTPIAFGLITLALLVSTKNLLLTGVITILIGCIEPIIDDDLHTSKISQGSYSSQDTKGLVEQEGISQRGKTVRALSGQREVERIGT